MKYIVFTLAIALLAGCAPVVIMNSAKVTVSGVSDNSNTTLRKNNSGVNNGH